MRRRFGTALLGPRRWSRILVAFFSVLTQIGACSSDESSQSDTGEDGGFGSPANNNEAFRYSLSQLNGDGLFDLVMTDGGDAGGAGAERWILHAGACE